MTSRLRARVFGRESEPESGNPAIVVWNTAHRTEDAFTAEARAADVPVVAFLLEGDPRAVRFFTPRAELSFCGHGALAVGAAEARRLDVGVVRLAARQQTFTVEYDGQEHAALVLSEPGRTAVEPRPEEVLAALGVAPADLAAGAIHVGSAGSPKWLVELASPEALARLAPDMAALEEVSRARDVNGAYVFTRMGDTDGVHVLARGFNPRGGVAEDAATGVAAAALGRLMQSGTARSRLVVDQGIELRNLNRIDVSVSGGQIRVGGRVTFEPEERPS